VSQSGENSASSARSKYQPRLVCRPKLKPIHFHTFCRPIVRKVSTCKFAGWFVRSYVALDMISVKGSRYLANGHELRVFGST